MSGYIISRFLVDENYECCAHVPFTIGLHIETREGSDVARC